MYSATFGQCGRDWALKTRAHTRLRAKGVVTSSGYGPSAVAFNIFGPVSNGASGQDVLLSGVPDGYPPR